MNNSSNIFAHEYIPSASVRIWNNFRNNRLAMLGLWLFIVFCILAIAAPYITPYPFAQQSNLLLLPPSWQNNGMIEHFLGTDDLGRDMLSRIIYGARLTFGSAILLTMIALFIGVPIGIAAGFTKGLKSSILHHLMDTALSIPSLIMALLLVSVMGMGLHATLIAVTLAQIPKFIRSTYNAVTEQMPKEYLQAIKLDGASIFHILKYGILPNTLETIVAQTTRALSSAILDIAALGFIGIGAQPPCPEWGNLLAGTRDLLLVAPWTVTLPGIAIMMSILSVNLVGEGWRKALSEGIE
ncbi:MAG: Peptide transport system permease protein SapC [Candidatus Celerinatantimonas neptuna]|nr:MAG: Peptide transport system permease protein SapC [Candidatus Celerinatantimonas neptuna]